MNILTFNEFAKKYEYDLTDMLDQYEAYQEYNYYKQDPENY